MPRRRRSRFARTARLKTFAKTNCLRLKQIKAFLQAKVLVIATGGLSFPKIGATDFGYRIARQFGFKNRSKPSPSLVPLVFEKTAQNFIKLAGVSIDSFVSSGKTFVSGKYFVHASRAFRSGDFANFKLLAKGKTDFDRFTAGKNAFRTFRKKSFEQTKSRQFSEPVSAESFCRNFYGAEFSKQTAQSTKPQGNRKNRRKVKQLAGEV